MKRNQIKLRKRGFHFKNHDIVTLIVILIMFLTFLIVISFNKYITPKILSAANMRLNNMTSVIVHRSFEKDVLKPEIINNIIIVSLNEESEIIGANFNYEKIYELASSISDKFNENFNYVETGQLDKIEYYDSDQIKSSNEGYVMALPIGIASNNIFIASLGPKIPVRVKFVGTVLTEVQTKITDYGINNALIEVNLEILIERQIITPVVNEIVSIPYVMPITSKIIYGKVPQFYAGVMDASSGNLNIPITE